MQKKDMESQVPIVIPYINLCTNCCKESAIPLVINRPTYIGQGGLNGDFKDE